VRREAAAPAPISRSAIGARPLTPCASSSSQECLDVILDKAGAEECQDPDIGPLALTLYGLIHARFIVTNRGLDAMLKKYKYALQLCLVGSLPHPSVNPCCLCIPSFGLA
jgi:hypothetical protein